MSSDRWRSARDLFDRALEIPAASRSSWLREHCGDDAALAGTVEALLTSDERAGAFMARLSVAPAPVREAEDGRRIGPYRLLRKLAEGGMGSVYLAARADELSEREVVLKLIRQGMESAETRRRLRTERRILAALEHPNIARLYDGGTTEDNLPYFVMERVDGLPIDEHCEAHRLTFAQRLELFRDVCSAVHCAHQSLVVHRDLKPSNILVTATGVPKLLDFGIAKLLDSEACPEGAATLPWARWLTPDYASPEQVLGHRITTASDVYSLGVLLCKLLTGELPHRFQTLTVAEIERRLRQRPATRPSELRRRAIEKTDGDRCQWPRELTGDLDNIVLKALHGDPRRRYASAEQLAEDLLRLRDGFPVRARPDHPLYRLRKFLHRQRAAVAVGAGFVALLIAGILALAVQSTRIARERDQLRAVVSFVKDVFNVAAEKEELTVRQAVDRSTVILDRRLRAQPEVRATLLDTTGAIYLNLWAIEPALAQLQQAVELRRRLYGDASLKTAESLSSLGLALAFSGELEEGEAKARQALELYSHELGERHPRVVRPLNNLVTLLCYKSDFKAAAEPSIEALALARELSPEDSEELVTAVGNRALALTKTGELAEAVALYREALELYRRYRGEEHPAVALVLNNLAAVLRRQGHLDEAEDFYLHALELMERLFGEGHSRLSLPLNNLASLQLEKGDVESAVASYRAVQGQVLGSQGPGSVGYLVTSVGLASALTAAGDPRSAEILLRSNLERWRAELGSSWFVAYAESALGASLTALGRFAEAERLLVSSYPIIRDAQGDESPKTGAALRRLIELYRAWGKPGKRAEHEALAR